MTQRETEPKLHISNIEKELNEALAWARDWSSLVWQRYRPPSLSQVKAPSEVEAEGIRILLTQIQNKQFGSINLLQLTRTVEEPNHPLVAQLSYTTASKKLLAISFKWPADSHVLSEYLSFPQGTVEEMVKVTNPGVLFSSPQISEEGNHKQQLQLYFYYNSKGHLKGWFGGIGFTGKELEGVMFHNGVLRGKVGDVQGDRSQGFGYLYQDQPYELPKTLDPLLHIGDFGNRRLVQPLIF